METGGEASPRDRTRIGGESITDPYVAIVCHDDGGAVGKKVNARGPEAAPPGVVDGQGDGLELGGVVVRFERRDFALYALRPAGAALCRGRRKGFEFACVGDADGLWRGGSREREDSVPVVVNDFAAVGGDVGRAFCEDEGEFLFVGLHGDDARDAGFVGGESFGDVGVADAVVERAAIVVVDCA